VKVSRNFLLSIGWAVGAVTHASESDDEFLDGLTDRLRNLYQLKVQDLEGQGVELTAEAWCIVKHLLAGMANDVEAYSKRKREERPHESLKKQINLEGDLIREVIEHYGAGEEREGEEEEG